MLLAIYQQLPIFSYDLEIRFVPTSWWINEHVRQACVNCIGRGSGSWLFCCVICNWDGLADDFSRTCTVPKVGRIWELTFESLATRKTRICFRVWGYLKSKLRFISNNVTLLKQPNRCLQKMVPFPWVFQVPELSSQKSRCSKAATALASALFCKR